MNAINDKKKTRILVLGTLAELGVSTADAIEALVGELPAQPERGIRYELPALVTTEELAEFLGVNKGTLYAWRLNRVGPDGRRVGKRVMYRREDIETWLIESPKHVR